MELLDSSTPQRSSLRMRERDAPATAGETPPLQHYPPSLEESPRLSTSVSHTLGARGALHSLPDRITSPVALMDLLILGAGMGMVGGMLPNPLQMIALTQVAIGPLGARHLRPDGAAPGG